ncbi:DUF1015 domain-containing protein [Candidatus Amarobacter glycogenicus]|uniref:DUF1015 domain-containing protein n=1 Tax=Candidatus Amarobacter glycogenicus TaxID=3140699 RepID=UPI002A0CEF73|nr:DUF1015 domain-containing protein [Dehalococcoidia bacterium]
MSQFQPFRGLRYTAAAGPLSELLAPPYDVITPAQQRALEERNPRNSVRLENAGGGEGRYAGVDALLKQWQSEGALARDATPMLYVYEQRFTEDGREYLRKAVLAAVEAQPWEEGAVKPHEYTMSGPKEDRLKLLQATGVQLSPVFMIARDRAGMLTAFIESTVASREPDVLGTSIDGDSHRLWAIESGTYEMRQLAPLLAESFYIADGHHRYETAVNYRDWRAASEVLGPSHPARFAMSAIVAASDPGLVIRPIHRMVPREAPSDWMDRLGDAFAVAHVKLVRGEAERSDELISLLDGADAVAINLNPGQVHRLKRTGSPLRGSIPQGMSDEWAAIAPNVLRYGVLEPLWGISDDDLRAGAVVYSHDCDEVLEFLDDNPHAVAFLLNPVSIESVISLADKGERMPQKSTFFHPKLGTGLVFNPLDA